MISIFLLFLAALGFLYGSIRLFTFSLVGFLASLFPLLIIVSLLGGLGVIGFHYYQSKRR